MPTSLPDELEYGYITDRILRAVLDTSADEDILPDGIAAQGTVTLTPLQKVMSAADGKVTIIRDPYVFNINQGDSTPGNKGLLMNPVTNYTGAHAVVAGWYSVTYKITGGPQATVSTIPALHVTPAFTPENPCWLRQHVELEPTPTEKFVINEYLYQQTLAARDQVVALVESGAGGPAGADGAPGAPGTRLVEDPDDPGLYDLVPGISDGDEAVATYLSTDGAAANLALKATIGQEVSPVVGTIVGEQVPAAVEAAVEGLDVVTGPQLATAATQRAVNGVRPPRITNTVTTFAPGHGFTVLGGAANATAYVDDTSTYSVGSQSAAVTTKDGVGGATSIQHTALPAVDATGKAIAVTLRIDNPADLTELIFYGTNDTSFASHFQWTVQDNGNEAQRFFKPGEWQTIVLSFADAVTVGSPNRAALTSWRLRARSVAGTTATVRYNRIALAEQPTEAVVSICVDDIYASTYTHLRPALDAYGYGATCYAIPERADLVGMDRLHQLEDVSGWEIASHGLTNLTTMPLDAVEADLIASRRWLIDNGFRGVDHYAYPGGGFSPAIERIMRRYYQSGRTIIARTDHETLPPANPYRLRSKSVSNTTTAAEIIAEIDAAKANGSWYILTIHDVVDSNANVGTKFLRSTLEQILTHINAQGIPVRTVGDVLSGF